MKKKHDKLSKAKEPSPEYQKASNANSLHFFSSFEEMNEYDHKEMATLTPEQRLQNITGMIKEIYKHELSEKMSDLTIHFKQ